MGARWRDPTIWRGDEATRDQTMPTVTINDDVMGNLQDMLLKRNAMYKSPVKVTEDALRLLAWAARELNEGRNIYSANPSDPKLFVLDMKGLTDRP
jgi:hypothetical protein